jgi:GntR family transcriptional regulator
MTTAEGKMSRALSRSSPEPLYRQLAQRLEADVRSGALKPGDQLESEERLTKRFQVSRITVRQAIEELARQQILVRKQGKGTFVTRPAVRHDLRRSHGLFNSLFSQAPNARTELLRYELAVPPADIAGAMRLAASETALALDRLYCIGDKPIGLAQDWLDPAIARIPRARAEVISTEEMMRACGIAIDYSQISIRAETAGAALGRVLRLSPRAAVLVHRRRSVGIDGAAKEIARLSVCSESYEFVGSTNRINPSGLGPMESLFDIGTVEESA